MGRDKAALLVSGVTLAVRTARLLVPNVTRAVEVGGGESGLPSVWEDPPGGGPLAAIVAGRRHLLELGLDGGAACLVVACDLPRLTNDVVQRLAAWPGDGSVLPVIDGRAQPLCARWSAVDLDLAASTYGEGERSLRGLPDRSSAAMLEEASWVDPTALRDADTPEDLARLGVASNER